MLNFFTRKSEQEPASAPGVSPYSSDLVEPRVMNEIGHLELLSRSVVDGLLAGKHRSTTKGGCCEFASHRQYSHGDEIRQIDWQVYARNDRYFIKQFEEDTNLHAFLAVDTTGSMKFGLSTVSKLDYAKRAAACLGRLLLRQRDAVGLMIVDEQNPLFLPPKQHAAHLRAVLSTLQNAEAAAATNDSTTKSSLGIQIRSFLPRMKRRGLFVLFSDCFSDLDELAAALKVVRARGHDVVVMHVLAPEEIRFDFLRWSSFRSLEQSSHRVNLDPAAIREEYLERMKVFLDELQQQVTGLGGQYVRMTTNRDLGETLGWFLRGRYARRNAVGV